MTTKPANSRSYQKPDDPTPLSPYVRQQFSTLKACAKREGITFTLTHQQWCDLWNRSGLWHLRGRLPHQYCLARINRSKGYTLDNVHITNNLELWRRTRDTEDTTSFFTYLTNALFGARK